MENIGFCQKLLIGELASRKARNRSYSMRAFARDLGIGSTSLSDVLAQKRNLSTKNVEKVVEKLALSPKEKDLLVSEINGRVRKGEKEKEHLELQEDAFRLIADWYYLAILNLAKLPDHQANPDWIANRLGIKTTEANLALERLSRMNLLLIEGNKLRRIKHPLKTSEGTPSFAIKKHHRDKLHLAEESLINDDVSLRNFQSLTLALDPENLPEAQAILTRAVKKIGKLLDGKNPKEVYSINFHVFPLTKRETNYEVH